MTLEENIDVYKRQISKGANSLANKSAEILCIGTEILMGNIVNTNATYIARGLATLGINVYHQSVVGDNPERLRDSCLLYTSRVGDHRLCAQQIEVLTMCSTCLLYTSRCV